MRIVIDMQGAQTGSRYRGIGRYTSSIVKEIILLAEKEQIFLLVNGFLPEAVDAIRNEFAHLLPAGRIVVWNSPGPVYEAKKENQWRREAAEYVREAVIMTLKPDFILNTSTIEGLGDEFAISVHAMDTLTPVASIVYDLIPLANPDEYLAEPNIRKWYENKIAHLEKSDLFLSISESSKSELVKYLDIDPNRIVNISAAVGEEFAPINFSAEQSEGYKNKFGISREFVLYSGATDARKNHLRLFEAYAALPSNLRAHHHLIIAGGLPIEHLHAFKDHAASLGLTEDDVIFTQRISDDELIALYNLAKGFVFPSWHEGFGLPALEAIACGCPVVASNTSSIPEVVGDERALFDPFDVRSIADTLELLLSDENYRNSIKDSQFAHGKTFSWRNSAKRVLNAIKEHHEIPSDCKKNQRLKTYKSGYYSYDLLIEKVSSIESCYSQKDLADWAICVARNQRIIGSRQLLVDLSTVVNKNKCLGRLDFSKSILSYFLDDCPSGWIVEPVYANGNGQYKYARQFMSDLFGIKNIKENDPQVSYAEGDIFVGLDSMDQNIFQRHQKEYEKMLGDGVSVYFFLRDLTPLFVKKKADNANTPQHINTYELISSATGLLCASEMAKKQLEVLLQNNVKSGSSKLPKIDSFDFGPDINAFVSNKKISQRSSEVLNRIKKQVSFLMVGDLEANNGYSTIIDTFEQLWQSEVNANLVILGELGDDGAELVEQICNHPEINQKLLWFNPTSESSLQTVYADCACLIVLSNGCDIPLLEAMRYQLPIVAQEAPELRSLLGNQAYYIDTDSQEALCDQLKRWLKMYEQNSCPKPFAMRKLTLKQTAAQLLSKMIT